VKIQKWITVKIAATHILFGHGFYGMLCYDCFNCSIELHMHFTKAAGRTNAFKRKLPRARANSSHSARTTSTAPFVTTLETKKATQSHLSNILSPPTTVYTLRHLFYANSNMLGKQLL